MFTESEMVEVATSMADVHSEGCFLGDFARGVIEDPQNYLDERSQDILLTFHETVLALNRR